MDEPVPDAQAHDGDGVRQRDRLLTRIRLWTRTAYSQEPVTADEVPAAGRIAGLSSIIARSRSPPTCLPSIARNGGQETNLTNGQAPRASARFNDRFERSRALSTKYGLDFTRSELPVPMNQAVQRVERSIRMRIRFWCHHCNTQYGNSRVCAHCSHQRCSRCTRHPPRRSTPRMRLADSARPSNALSAENLHAHLIAEAAADAPYIPIPIIPHAYTNGGHHSVPQAQTAAVSPTPPPPPPPPPLPNGTGQEHPHPPPSRTLRRNPMRIRHICHQCQGSISAGESACSRCGHERCKDCLQHPSRRGNPVTSSSSRTLDHSTSSWGSESDDGGDEFENETIPEEPPSPVPEARAAETMTRPTSLFTRVESIDARDGDGAPPEPPPPV